MRRFYEVQSIKRKADGGSLAIWVQSDGLSFALDLGGGSILPFTFYSGSQCG
jgi:hypothetical protein